MPTITAVVIPVLLVAIAVVVWLLLRDPGPPPPGRHRRQGRDPHDTPLIGDDEEPPEQTIP
jgi:hypothetical protein